MNFLTIRNSRRLRDAWATVEAKATALRRRVGEELTVADCEGDQELYADIATRLRTTADALTLRFKYLKIVPWCFANADTVEGAAEFVRGAMARPAAEQDPLTAYLFEKHEVELRARAAGGECGVALAREVEEVNQTPLDESAGEGYHRSSNLTRLRCSNARTPYIAQSTRTSSNMNTLRTFL